MSAGTMSPRRSSTTSPGTSSVTSTVGGRPSRIDDGLVADLVVQRLGGLLGPVLVDEAEPDRQAHDHADDDRVAALADEVGRHRRGHQQPQQRRAQLVPQHRERASPVRGDRVRSPLFSSARDLRLAQPSLGNDTLLAQHRDAVERTSRSDPCAVASSLRRCDDSHALQPERQPGITARAEVPHCHGPSPPETGREI